MLPVTVVVVYGLPAAGKSSLCSSLLQLGSGSKAFFCPSDSPNKHSTLREKGEPDALIEDLDRITITDIGTKQASKDNSIQNCLSASTKYVHVCFDSLISFKEQERYASIARSLKEVQPSSNADQCSTEFDPSAAWKKARKEVHSKVEQFLRQVRQCEQNRLSLNDLFSRCDCISNSSSCHDIPPSSLVILLDDNFYYRSMRQPYYALAGTYGAGFCEVLVKCSMEEALERNSRRSEETKVPCDVIRRMAHKMEPAAPLSNPWEQQSLEIVFSADEKSFDRLAVLQLIQTSLVSPVILTNTEEARKLQAAAATESRTVCSRSVLHQADLLLRQLVAETAKKGASVDTWNTIDNCGPKSVREMVKEANTARQQILKEMKAGVPGLPPCLSEDYTLDMTQVLTSALRDQFRQKITSFQV